MKKKDVRDNKQFWRTVKPLLSDKMKSSEIMSFVKGDKIISEGEKTEAF